MSPEVLVEEDDQGPTVVVYRETDEEIAQRQAEQQEQAERAREVAESLRG